VNQAKSTKFVEFSIWFCKNIIASLSAWKPVRPSFMAINVPARPLTVKAATEFAENVLVLNNPAICKLVREEMFPIELLSRVVVACDGGRTMRSLRLKSVITSNELPVPSSDSFREL